EVLPVVGDVDRFTHLEIPAVQCALADDRAHERRLAGAVRADEADHLASGDTCGEVLDQDTAANLEPDILRDEYLVAPAAIGLQPQRHCAALAGRRTQARKAGESRPPPLCLAAVLTGDVAPDVLLLRCDDLLLVLVRTLLREAALAALLDERAVAACVRHSSTVLQVQNVIGHCIEECAVVAYHEYRAVELA